MYGREQTGLNWVAEPRNVGFNSPLTSVTPLHSFTGAKKYLQLLEGGTPPFLPVFTHSANCALKAGPRHSGVKPRPFVPPELLSEMFPPCQTAGGP